MKLIRLALGNAETKIGPRPNLNGQSPDRHPRDPHDLGIMPVFGRDRL